eukprot:2123404-Amphidinium_carterae.1
MWAIVPAPECQLRGKLLQHLYNAQSQLRQLLKRLWSSRACACKSVTSGFTTMLEAMAWQSATARYGAVADIAYYVLRLSSAQASNWRVPQEPPNMHV